MECNGAHGTLNQTSNTWLVEYGDSSYMSRNWKPMVTGASATVLRQPGSDISGSPPSCSHVECEGWCARGVEKPAPYSTVALHTLVVMGGPVAATKVGSTLLPFQASPARMLVNAV